MHSKHTRLPLSVPGVQPQCWLAQHHLLTHLLTPTAHGVVFVAPTHTSWRVHTCMQAARYGEVQAARLRQLEMGGLVDYTPASPGDPEAGVEAAPACATFIVIGSTGNHYIVKLTEPKFTCTCLDHRFRRWGWVGGREGGKWVGGWDIGDGGRGL